MKKVLFSLTIIFLSVCAFAQDQYSYDGFSKYEQLENERGQFFKFSDIEIVSYPFGQYSPGEKLLGNEGKICTSVRTVFSKDNNNYFYCLLFSTPPTYYQAFIEYSDLVEINKALSQLYDNANEDISENSDISHNSYTSKDGFEIGYNIRTQKNKKYAAWYFILRKPLKFHAYDASEIDVRDINVVIKGFKDAQSKIEELMNKYGK
jgi:hypothetical protein